MALMTIVDAAPTPPSAPTPPTNFRGFAYPPYQTRIYAYWENSDPTAYTNIYVDGALKATLNPGVTYWYSTYYLGGTTRTWSAKHQKGGLESTAVSFVVNSTPIP